ncbi:MAG TPA: RidA family protein [Vicinamibacteria bacterium]|jgi:enamine deaminase RidA (YjgF/YER057c/UK114 family)|nr:RidA family protein [Vicinamibacteria bacterium]
MPLTPVNPPSLARPQGYSHGIKGTGELLFVAGQIGWNRDERIVSDDLVEQFAQALDNLMEVVGAAGGGPNSVARLLIYVTDKTEYVRRRQEIGVVYRGKMGKHFPAMALVEVKSLLEDRAQIEIEGVALL